MQIDFAGKRVLVTGAGKGIGRDIVRELAACNAQVIALSRTQADLESLAADVPCETVTVDLADSEATKNAVEAVGPVDLLVNNAGINVLQPFLDVTVEAFDSIMAVNVRAALVVSQVVARGLIARGAGGAIVNVSSQSSLRALHDHASYCASKGALDQLTRVMALELGPHNIRTNAVNPTVVMTPLGKRAWGDPAKSEPMKARIPLGHFAEPEDVSRVVAFLLSDHAAMINGAVLPIDGGFTVT